MVELSQQEVFNCPVQPLCVYTPFVWQNQPRQKTLVAVLLKNLVKNTQWLRHLVFFTRFFKSTATSVFVLVDSATLREYKLFDSYLQKSIYEFD